MQTEAGEIVLVIVREDEEMVLLTRGRMVGGTTAEIEALEDELRTRKR